MTAPEHVTGAMRFRSADAESAAMLDAGVDLQYTLGLYIAVATDIVASAHARLYELLVELALT